MDKLERCVQLLKDIEWSGLHTDDENWAILTRACPVCMNAKSVGHKCGCQLAELISNG